MSLAPLAGECFAPINCRCDFWMPRARGAGSAKYCGQTVAVCAAGSGGEIRVTCISPRPAFAFPSFDLRGKYLQTVSSSSSFKRQLAAYTHDAEADHDDDDDDSDDDSDDEDDADNDHDDDDDDVDAVSDDDDDGDDDSDDDDDGDDDSDDEDDGDDDSDDDDDGDDDSDDDDD